MSSARTKRGSTLIEVLMAISVLAVGASGVIAMQKVTLTANRNAKNLEIANEIARTWAERLQSDALLWNHPSADVHESDLSDTRWISSNVGAPGSSAWFRPIDAGTSIYGVHNAMGKDDGSGNGFDGPFCVNLRLTWLRPDQDLIRAEVRVYWLRDGIQPGVDELPAVASPLCGSSSTPPNVTGNQELYHFVHITTALRKNPPL